VSTSQDSKAREERIRRRAEALYRRRGNRPGSALDDWIRAEKEIRETEEQAIEQSLDETFSSNDPPAN